MCCIIITLHIHVPDLSDNYFTTLLNRESKRWLQKLLGDFFIISHMFPYFSWVYLFRDHRYTIVLFLLLRNKEHECFYLFWSVQIAFTDQYWDQLLCQCFTFTPLRHTFELIYAATWENQQSAWTKTKAQIGFAVIAKLISAIVFATCTRIVQFLCFLNLKFPASSHLLCLYSSVCVGPFQKSHCWLSHDAAPITIRGFLNSKR